MSPTLFLFYHFYFLVPQNAPDASCVFPVRPVVILSPKILVPFTGGKYLRINVRWLSVLIATWVSLLCLLWAREHVHVCFRSRTFSQRSVRMCIRNHDFILGVLSPARNHRPPHFRICHVFLREWETWFSLSTVCFLIWSSLVHTWNHFGIEHSGLVCESSLEHPIKIAPQFPSISNFHVFFLLCTLLRGYVTHLRHRWVLLFLHVFYFGISLHPGCFSPSCFDYVKNC